MSISVQWDKGIDVACCMQRCVVASAIIVAYLVELKLALCNC